MKANQFAKDDEAQVGIGTMVVFIATILVAAVAAGVLISIGGDLQAQSKATGQEASNDVANALTIVRAYGVDVDDAASTEDLTLNDGDDQSSVEALDELHLYVRLAAGSGSIDFNQVEVLLDTGSGVTTYAFTDEYEQSPGNGNAYDEVPLNGGPGTAPTIGDGSYFTAIPQGSATGSTITGNQMFLIRILGDFTADPLGDDGDADGTPDQTWGNRLNLTEDQDLAITIVLPNGSPTFMELSTPRVFDETYEKLY